jgi:hypothetical protein
MRVSSRSQHKPPVAIRAFDEILVAHFEIDPRMAERAAGAVAMYAGGIDFDDFGGFDGHGIVLNQG